MITWTYTIRMGNGDIFTTNPRYAEQKSKQGYCVFCRRSSNVFKYHH